MASERLIMNSVDEFSEWQVSQMMFRGNSSISFFPSELASLGPLNSEIQHLILFRSERCSTCKLSFHLWFKNCIWIASCFVIHAYVTSFLPVGMPHLPASLVLIDLLAPSELYDFKVLQTHSCHSNLNTMLLLLRHLFYKLPLCFLFHLLGVWEVEDSIPINCGAKKSG